MTFTTLAVMKANSSTELCNVPHKEQGMQVASSQARVQPRLSAVTLRVSRDVQFFMGIQIYPVLRVYI